MVPTPALSDRLRSLLGGPLPAWPELADRAAERWFRSAPRARLAITAVGILLLLVAAGRLASRSPWGDDVAVLVAARDLPPGHTLSAGDLVPEVRPLATVPSGALDSGTAWVGAVTAGFLPSGATVAAGHLADGGLTDLVAAGRVAVAVPADLLPPLPPGRRVDLVGGADQQGGQHLARNGRVLAGDGDHVWIEVDRDDAGAVSAAVAWGRITVALLPD